MRPGRPRTIGDRPSVWESALPAQVLQLPEELCGVRAVRPRPRTARAAALRCDGEDPYTSDRTAGAASRPGAGHAGRPELRQAPRRRARTGSGTVAVRPGGNESRLPAVQLRRSHAQDAGSASRERLASTRAIRYRPCGNFRSCRSGGVWYGDVRGRLRRALPEVGSPRARSRRPCSKRWTRSGATGGWPSESQQAGLLRGSSG
jgi:hypothetical protein